MTQPALLTDPRFQHFPNTTRLRRGQYIVRRTQSIKFSQWLPPEANGEAKVNNISKTAAAISTDDIL